MQPLVECIPENCRDAWLTQIRKAVLEQSNCYVQLSVAMNPESFARELMRDKPHPWRKKLMGLALVLATIPVMLLLAIMCLGMSDNLEELIVFLPGAGDDPSRNRAMLEEVVLGVTILSGLFLAGLAVAQVALYFLLKDRTDTDAFLALPANIDHTTTNPNVREHVKELLDRSALSTYEQIRSETSSAPLQNSVYLYLEAKAFREVRDQSAVDYFVRVLGALLTHRDKVHTEAAAKGLWSLMQHYPLETARAVAIDTSGAPVVTPRAPVRTEFHGPPGSAASSSDSFNSAESSGEEGEEAGEALARVQQQAGVTPGQATARRDVTADEVLRSMAHVSPGGIGFAAAVATPLAVVMRTGGAGGTRRRAPRPDTWQRYSVVVEGDDVVLGTVAAFGEPAIDLYRLPLLGEVATGIPELQHVPRSVDESFSEIGFDAQVLACQNTDPEYCREFLGENDQGPVQAPELGAIGLQTARRLGLQLHTPMERFPVDQQQSAQARQLVHIVSRWMCCVDYHWSELIDNGSILQEPVSSEDATAKVQARNRLIDELGLMCVALLKPGLLPSMKGLGEEQELWHRWEYYTSQSAINTRFFERLPTEIRVRLVHILLSRVRDGMSAEAAAELTLRSREVHSGALLVLGLLHSLPFKRDWWGRTPFATLFRGYVTHCILESDTSVFWCYQHAHVLFANLYWLLEPASGCIEVANQRLATGFLNANDRRFYLSRLVPTLNQAQYRERFTSLRVRLLGLLLYGAVAQARQRSRLFTCGTDLMRECRNIIRVFQLSTAEQGGLFAEHGALHQYLSHLPEAEKSWALIKKAALNRRPVQPEEHTPLLLVN